MFLSPNINNREFDKFTLNDDGDTAVRVVGMSTVTGTISVSGLRIAIKVTTMDVTDVATPLPATALTDRNSMTIQNKHATQKLYVGPSNVTADTVNGTTSGWEIPPQNDFNVDITDDITLYGRAETGQTIKIKVVELA